MKIFSDDPLIRRYRSGDKEAFDEIVVRYQKKVCALLLRMVRLRDLAEELTQETFYRLFKHLESPEPDEGEALTTLIFRIAKNLAIDYKRHDTIETNYLAELAADSEEMAPDPALASWEIRADLRRAISKLPDAERPVAKLRFLLDYKPSEIAKILGLPPEVVHDRLRRAREALRMKLAPYKKGLNHDDERDGRMGRAASRTGRSTAGPEVRLPRGALEPAAEGASRGEEGENPQDRALLHVRGGSGDRRRGDAVDAVALDAADDVDDEPADVC